MRGQHDDAACGHCCTVRPGSGLLLLRHIPTIRRATAVRCAGLDGQPTGTLAAAMTATRMRLAGVDFAARGVRMPLWRLAVCPSVAFAVRQAPAVVRCVRSSRLRL